MKIFARITAAVAVLLIICSLLLLTVTTLLQGPISGCFTDIREFMPQLLGKWKINVPWMAFLTCFMQILCIAPMIFLAGRKKGGIWIEIVLLALLLVGIPAVRYLVDTVDFFVKITDFYGLSLENLTDIRRLWLERMLYDMGLYNYIVVDGFKYGGAWLNEVVSWCLPAAAAGQFLGLVVCSMSMAYGIKSKKQKKAIVQSDVTPIEEENKPIRVKVVQKTKAQ